MTPAPAAALRKFVAPEIVFGPGARFLVGRYGQNLFATHAMVVTDPNVGAAGWVADVEAELARHGIDSTVEDNVTPNPRAEEVMAAADRFARCGCDLIVAVGGGSPIDLAKGVGIVHANGQHVLTHEGVDQVALPGPPLLCIPTTAGSAADVSQFAIITDTAQRRKVAIISKTVVPDAALIDPEPTRTMDAYLTACTGMDVLVHAIEAFLSKAHSAMTDLHALEAVRLVAANLPTAVADPDDMAAREKMMQASMHAGIAFSNASLGAVHAMAHSLGGFLDLAHGECNAMLLDAVLQSNMREAADRCGIINDVLQQCGDLRGAIADGRDVVGTVRELKAKVGITSSLSQRGVAPSDIANLAEKACRDPCMITNPRQLGRRDLEEIYGMAL